MTDVRTRRAHGDAGFAAYVKTATDSAHRAAEDSTFMADLLRGDLAEAAYIELEAQSLFLYRALEDGGRLLGADPLVAPFLDDRLLRTPSLERDLRHHLGDGWESKVGMLESTRRYAERISAVAADWPAGYIAHHYLRYLGDLSGGQIIRTRMSRTYGYDRDGVRFYIFEEIPKPKPYKDAYRAKLDALALPEDEAERFVAEVSAGFDFNRDLFADLQWLHGRAGAAV